MVYCCPLVVPVVYYAPQGEGFYGFGPAPQSSEVPSETFCADQYVDHAGTTTTASSAATATAASQEQLDRRMLQKRQEIADIIGTFDNADDETDFEDLHRWVNDVMTSIAVDD